MSTNRILSIFESGLTDEQKIEMFIKNDPEGCRNAVKQHYYNQISDLYDVIATADKEVVNPQINEINNTISKWNEDKQKAEGFTLLSVEEMVITLCEVADTKIAEVFGVGLSHGDRDRFMKVFELISQVREDLKLLNEIYEGLVSRNNNVVDVEA